MPSLRDSLLIPANPGLTPRAFLYRPFGLGLAVSLEIPVLAYACQVRGIFGFVLGTDLCLCAVSKKLFGFVKVTSVTVYLREVESPEIDRPMV